MGRHGVRRAGLSRMVIVLDEVQRVPLVLNEVHRLIEADGRRFLLTGSSARSLRRRGVNLLGGRARTLRMYPLTAAEAGSDFSLERALVRGQLPSVYRQPDRERYLASYVESYLRQEIIEDVMRKTRGGRSPCRGPRPRASMGMRPARHSLRGRPIRRRS